MEKQNAPSTAKFVNEDEDVEGGFRLGGGTERNCILSNI